MKVYLGFTAALFALLAVLDLWRMIAESSSLARDPWFLVITVVSAGLSGWALRLLATMSKSGPRA
jgi:NO-binding membrane sensor protein with MHYT domain